MAVNDFPTPPLPEKTSKIFLISFKFWPMISMSGSWGRGWPVEQYFWPGQPLQASDLPADSDSVPGQAWGVCIFFF